MSKWVLPTLWTTLLGACGGESPAAATLLVLDPEAKAVRKISTVDFRSDSLKRYFSRPRILGVLDDGSMITYETPVYSDTRMGGLERGAGDPVSI